MYWWYAMQIKTVWKNLALSCFAFGVSQAYANIQIFPAKGIYGLEQECRKSVDTIEANAASISCEFKSAVSSAKVRDNVQQAFEAQLKQSLPNEVITQITQQNKHRTYVASLEVIRASEYIVYKESTAEIFLPVTLSLKLTNILTGEVIYSDSETLSQPLKVLASQVNAIETRKAIQDKYQDSLIILSQKITQGLQHKFKVSEIQTDVIDRWKSYIVLDKGFNQGIAKNDELSTEHGDLIRIVHADSDYAVALPVLMQGNPKKFSKISNNTRQAMNKPKALIVDVLTYKGEAKDLIEQIFADAIGENASFTLTPVNKRYSTLAQSVSEQTGLSNKETILQRELPEFFIRLNIIPVIGYQQKIGKMTEQQVIHSEVFAEMVDRTGRVIYSAHAKDEISEKISEGMGFNLEDRKEVSLKNALIKLGKEFQQGLKFTRTDLQVLSGGSEHIMIEDDGERLALGAKIHIYNKEKVAQRNVLIPTWEATVVDRQGAKVKAQLDFQVSGNDRLPVRSGDIVLVDSHAPVGDSKKSRVLCPTLHTEQVGEIPFYGFGPLIYHAFTSQSKQPFYASGSGFRGQTLLSSAITRMTENSGFKKELNLKLYVPKEECLQPAFKINVKEETIQCNADKSNCNATIVLAGGVRRFNSQLERVGAVGLQQEIELKGINHTHRNEMYNIQMFNSLPKILNQIVQKADSTQ